MSGGAAFGRNFFEVSVLPQPRTHVRLSLITERTARARTVTARVYTALLGCKRNGVDRLFTSRYGLRHTMRRGPNLAPPEPGTGRPPFGQRMRIRFLRYRISGRDPGSPHPLGAAILSAAVARRAAGLARAGSRRSARCAAAAERSAGSR